MTTANNLPRKFNSYSSVRDLQPYIGVAGYEQELATLLNPFG